MKIFIDDVRFPPDSSWLLVKDVASAMKCIKHNLNEVTLISFDHDLGEDVNQIPTTTIPIATYLEELAYNGQYPKQLKLQIHSANPVGRKNLELIFKSIQRFINNDK